MITFPGKFRDEPEYVSIFWDLVLNNFQDSIIQDDFRPVFYFYLTDADHEKFNISDDFYSLSLWEDDQGFVHSHLSRSS